MPDTASVTIPTIAGDVTVVFYPERIDLPFAAKQLIGLKLYTNTRKIKMCDKTLAHLIKSWDVFEDDEVTMFPLKQKRLAILPISFKLDVLNAILATKRSMHASNV